MGKSFLQSSSNIVFTYEPYTWSFSPVGMLSRGITPENFEIRLGSAGVWSDISVFITSNNTNAVSTIHSRIDGVHGSQSMSVPNYATGRFTQTQSDNITKDSKVAIDVIPGDDGGGSGTSFFPSNITSVFKPSISGSTTSFFGGIDGTSRAADTTRYSMGGSGWVTTTEANSQVVMPISGSFKKMWFYVSAFTATEAKTMVFRKNGSNGNQQASFNGTGYFSDDTGVDEVSMGDLVNMMIAGGGTGNYRIRGFVDTFESISSKFLMGCGGNNIDYSPAGPVARFPFSTTQYSTFDPSAIYNVMPLTASFVGCYVSNNNNSDQRTLHFGTNLVTYKSINVPTGSVGWFSSSISPEHHISSGSYLSNYYSNGGQTFVIQSSVFMFDGPYEEYIPPTPIDPHMNVWGNKSPFGTSFTIRNHPGGMNVLFLGK